MKKNTIRIVAAVIAVVFLFVMVISFAACSSKENEPAVKTVERKALSEPAEVTFWYEDNVGFVENPKKILQGLKKFYNKTGVQPVVVFFEYNDLLWIDETNLYYDGAVEYLESYYDEHFEDESHFILAYFATEEDNAEMYGTFTYFAGDEAKKIMDEEMISILLECFDVYYFDTTYPIDEMMGNTFSDLADRIEIVEE